LKVLQGDRTLCEIASTNNVTHKNIQNWKGLNIAHTQVHRKVQTYIDKNIKKVMLGNYDS